MYRNEITETVLQRKLHSFTHRIARAHNATLLVAVLTCLNGVSLAHPQSALGLTTLLDIILNFNALLFYSVTDLPWNVVKYNTRYTKYLRKSTITHTVPSRVDLETPQFLMFQIHIVQKNSTEALCEPILTSSCCAVTYLDSTWRHIVDTSRWTEKREMARGDGSKDLKKRTGKQENAYFLIAYRDIPIFEWYTACTSFV